MTDQVDILLATYQGALFIRQQICSIFTQTYPHVHVWIRDDGSSDNTLQLIQHINCLYPHSISTLPGQTNLGIKGNFSELMKHSTAPYVMFSDQDDVWLPNKIEYSLALMKKMEMDYGCQVPLLVHTDLKVVKSNLTEIHPSFWSYANLNPRLVHLNRLLPQNVLTGCTMLMNRALVELAHPIPNEAIMHDWWIALVASSFGHIRHLNLPTVLYRQHGSNDTGAKLHSMREFIKRTWRPTSKKSDCLSQTYIQAQVFLERYADHLDKKSLALLRAYIALEQLPYLQQKKQILKYRFLKNGFLRNLKGLLQ